MTEQELNTQVIRNAVLPMGPENRMLIEDEERWAAIREIRPEGNAYAVMFLKRDGSTGISYAHVDQLAGLLQEGGRLTGLRHLELDVTRIGKHRLYMEAWPEGLTSIALKSLMDLDLSGLNRFNECTSLRLTVPKLHLSTVSECLSRLRYLECTNTEILLEKGADLCFPGLETFVSRRGRSAERLLEATPGLHTLSVCDWGSSDLRQLRRSRKLKVIRISGDSLRSCSGVDSTEAEVISLSSRGLDVLAPLAGTGVRRLRLCNVPTTDFTVLSALDELEELELFNCGFQDVEVVKKLPKLHTLRLSGTQVTDFSPLLEMGNLRVLQIQQQPPISNVAQLLSMVQLRELWLDMETYQGISSETHKQLERQGSLTLLPCTHYTASDIQDVGR